MKILLPSLRAAKVIALRTTVLLLSVALLEGGAALILATKYGIAGADLELAYRRVMNELPLRAEVKTNANEAAKHLTLGHELNPFFGFTWTRNFPGTNNFGFFSGVSFPYKKQPGEYVIAMFGGSVAQQLFSDQEALAYLRSILEPEFQRRGFDHIVFLNIALPGWRQPQQYYALHYFLRSIDMAITLDGVNEGASIDTNLNRNYPIDYPDLNLWVPLSQGALSSEDIERFARIFAEQDGIRQISNALKVGLPSYSHFCHLIWQIAVDRKRQKIQSLRWETAKAVASQNYNISQTDPADKSQEDEMVKSYFDLYEASVTAAYREARAMNRLSFHFIQPNQYVPGSKPLSDEEKQRFVNDQHISTAMRLYYPMITDMVERLRGQGIAISSLVDVFNGVHETLYRDNCCHLNEAGHKILARSIGKEILGSGQLRDLSLNSAAASDPKKAAASTH